MNRIASIVGLVSLTVFVVGSTCAFAQATASPVDGTSRWGIRVGLATDPDQIVVGANFLETKIADRLFLEPDAEIGVGDDETIVSATAPFHYRFEVQARVRPYAGGGVTIGLLDRDKGDTDLEIALRATGGVLFRLKGGQEMFAELNLVFGDLHDVQAMIGWRF